MKRLAAPFGGRSRTGESSSLIDSSARSEIEVLRRRVAEMEAELRSLKTPENRPSDAALAQAITDLSTYAVLTEDLHGRILSWNRGAERMFGYTAAEAIGQAAVILADPEKNDAEEILDRVRNGYSVENHPTVRRTRDGRKIHISLSVSPLRDHNGQIIGAAAIARDQTERRSAEQALREAERRYSALFANKTNGIAHCRVIVDANGNPVDYQYLDLNDGYEMVTGRRRADLIGKTAREIFPSLESAGDGYIARFGRIGLEGGELSLETSFEGRWYSVYAYSPRQGEFTLICNNITDRKEAEQKLQERESQLARLIENAPVALAMFDRSMRFIAASRRMSTEYRIPEPSQLIGRSHYEVFPDIPERWREIHQRVLEGEQLSCEEDEFPRADGHTEWVRWLMRPWYTAKGAIGGAVLFAENITQAVATRRAREAAERKAREVDQRLRRVLERLADGFVSFDRERRFTYVNAEAERFLKRRREELLGRHWRDAVPEAGHFAREFENAVARRTPVTFEDYYAPLNAWLETWAYPSNEGISVFFRNITERKRSEEALRESEERFRGTFENAAVGMAHLELDGRWIRVNDRLCEFLGYSREELMQLTFEDVTHPGDIEADWAQARAVIAGEIPRYQMEKRYIRKDGRVVWGNITVSLMRDPAGRPLHFISIVEDISERRRAENALRLSEETLLSFFNSTPLVMGVVETSDDDILHISGNRAAQEYFAGSTSGRWWSELGVSRERIRFLLAHYRTARETKQTVRFECPVDPRAGAGTLSVSLSFIRISRNGLPRFSYVIEDITARKQAEEELERNQERLRESEARFRGLVECVPSVLFITDANGMNEFVSPAWTQYGGLTAEESAGRGWDRLLHPDDAERARETWMQVIRMGAPSEIEFRLRRHDGVYHWFIVRAQPVRDAQGQIVKWIGSATDIENQKQTELALRIAIDDLNRFAFAAAHDLREPLRNIGAYSEMLVTRFAPSSDAKVTRAAEIIQDGVERMDRLLADLLEYSHATNIESHEEMVDSNAALAKALEDLRPAILESRATISADNLPEIPGHESQLVRIFQNLIGNAIKYRGSNLPEVRISAQRDDGHWLFRVSDNGQGIDPEFRGHIFGMFKRLHGREIPGTGIGLAICAKIIESRGGRIWVESQPGKGSAFLFTWPTKHGVPAFAPRQMGVSRAV